MKYSYEFKKNCIELYKQGKWADTPRGINKYYFRNYIRRWNNLVETHGIEVLKHKSHNNSFLVEDKYNSVLEVVKGKSTYQVSIELGISEGNIQNWVNKYKIYGYNGLVNKKKGRKSQNTTMKKTNIHKAKKLNESEREELIRLRAENEYIQGRKRNNKKRNRLERKELRCATQGEKAAIVKKLKEKGYRLKYLLIAIDLPKSTYYYEINKIDAVKIRNKNIEIRYLRYSTIAKEDMV